MYYRLKVTITLLSFFLLPILMPTQIRAQSSGATAASLIGVVNDQQGAVIVGASITAVNLATNSTRESTSREDGSFVIPQMAPGDYEIRVSAAGFTTKTLRASLLLGTITQVTFALSIDTGSDVIEINANAAVEEGKTESSTNVDSNEIAALPINRRDFMEFSLTAARVVKDGLPPQGAIATSGLSFNGQSARLNNITIDGLDNNDPSTGTARATFGQDAVREFQVISDGYSAEFGRALGGVINIVTKGGSNNFHGTLFSFIRNDELATRDVFAPFKPEYKQYQFGTTFSGPIKKDKAFFFGSFERLSVKQNNFVTISDTTVAAARRQGFALSNGPLPFGLGTTTYLLRADLQLTPNDSINVRYNGGGTFNGNFDPFGGLVGDSNAGIQVLDDSSLAFSNIFISPRLNLVNETRFLYGQREQGVLSSVPGPQVRIFAPEGLVTFGRSVFPPQLRDQTIYQIVNNTTLTRGRQTIKFGIDYLYNNSPKDKTTLCFFCEGLGVFNPIDFGAILGNPAFPSFTALQAFDANLRTPEQRAFLMQLAAGLPPGIPKNLADLSLPLGYLQLFADTSVNFKVNEIAAYVQDDIKVRANLVVKAGLRYDLIRVKLFPNNSGNISPRFSAAYRPSENMFAHFSYGVFFGQFPVVFPAAINNTTAPNSFLILPFPFSIIPFATPKRAFPADTKLPAAIPFIPQLVPLYRFQTNLRNSYAQQFNMGFDYFIEKNTALSFNSILVRGLKLVGLRNINPVVRPIMGDPLGSIITGRSNPGIGEFQEFQSSFDSYYYAATVSVNRRLANNFSFLAHYTMSKAIDNTDDFNPLFQLSDNPLKPGNERGLSLQDVRNRFVLSGIWDLNYTKNRLLRDFRLSSIMSFSSGRPYNLLAGVDVNQNGDNPPGDRPRIGDTPVGRNAGIKPGFANVDLRLTRTLTFNERVRLQGFFEIFNLFNRKNIDSVAALFPPDAQGRFNLPERGEGGRFIATPDRFITAFPSRQIQLGFRASF